MRLQDPAEPLHHECPVAGEGTHGLDVVRQMKQAVQGCRSKRQTLSDPPVVQAVREH